MSIFRFGFFATFTLYLVLLLSEYLRPGFVVTNGNVHWLWVVVMMWIVIDVWAMKHRRLVTEDGEGSRGSFLGRLTVVIVLAVASLLLGLLVWRVGEAFGGMRLLFALAAAVTPGILVRSSRIH